MLRRAVNDNPVTALAVMIGVVLVITWLLLALLVPESKATSTLEKQGYENIHVTDKSIFAIQWRSCDKLDLARFTATAKSPDGTPSQLYVCVSAFSIDVVHSN